MSNSILIEELSKRVAAINTCSYIERIVEMEKLVAFLNGVIKVYRKQI